MCGPTNPEAATSVYDVAGLLFDSPIPLAARPGPAGQPAVQVTIEGSRAQPKMRPSADVLAERSDDRFVFYSFCVVDDGFIARFYGSADIWISADLDQVVCFPAPRADTEHVGMLLTGAVAAFIHAQQGRMALHASAVALSSGVVAFAGPSGQGKSTLASQLVAAGAQMVTDDVLIVEPPQPGEPVWVRPGATEIRLRTDNYVLDPALEQVAGRRSTVDGRVALKVRTTPTPRLPLSLVVHPVRVEGTRAVEARRMGPAEAIALIAGSQRIEGWRSAPVLGRHFAIAGDIVERVPVLWLETPFGPSYTREFADEFVQSCARAAGQMGELIL